MSDNNVSAIGNATREPELRFTQSGLAIAQFGLAVNRRWPSKQKPGEWEEKVSFIDVIAWGQFAENVADCVTKGMRLIVVGRFEQNTWEDKETGKNRSKIELVAEAIGPDLKWATATVEKNERRGSHLEEREPDFAYTPAGPGPGEPEEPF